MPYIRAFFIGLIVLCVGIAVFVAPSPLFTRASFSLVLILIVLLLVMAATRDFYLQFVSLLFAAFYVQRVIVLYFDDGLFEYARAFFPQPETISMTCCWLWRRQFDWKCCITPPTESSDS